MSGGPLFIHQSDAANWSTLVPADANCTIGVQWIWTVMGQCVLDARGMAAVCFGFISIIAWILNGIPQIIENFRTGIPDQAMSPFLLTFWTIGDINSLIGCVLTHQLVLQTVVSVYSIGNDCVLIGQFIYYKMKHRAAVDEINDALGDGYVPPREEDLVRSFDNDDTEHLLPETSTSHDRPGTQLFAVTGIFGLAGLSLYPGPGTPPVQLTATTPNNLINSPPVSPDFRPPFLEGTSAKIGYFLGCVSGLMYISSRLPQICQNAQLSNREACENWRAKDRLTSSLLAIFPACLIGQRVTVTLLDETKVTGCLLSCDGMLNVELEKVTVKPNGANQPYDLHAITIFGRRIRHVSLPESLDVHKSLLELNRRQVYEFTQRSTDRYTKRVKKQTTTEAEKPSTVNKFEIAETELLNRLHQSNQCESLGLHATGDRKVDVTLAKTLDFLIG